MISNQKILFVDDDPEVLASYRRAFRKTFRLDTAEGPVRGLEAMVEDGPYAVVVSDLRMPGMDGIEFFTRLRKTCPDTVRIMLTGYADIRAAIAAVNAGNVFRFLAKPCPEAEVEEAIKAGLTQYGLINAEKEFLKGTLRGTIKVLTDLLALLNSEAHGRSTRIKRLVMDMGRYLEYPDLWRLELAVMLSQIGCAVLPEAMLAAFRREGRLEPERQKLFEMHPKIAADLLANIPKLAEIAEIIRYQEKRFNGSGPPDEDRRGVDIPLGARLLKAALDYDGLTCSGKTKAEAVEIMKGRREWYDPKVLQLVESFASGREGYARARKEPSELAPGMILDQDAPLSGEEGALCKGTELDAEMIGKLAASGSARIQVLAAVEENAILGRLDPNLIRVLKNARKI